MPRTGTTRPSLSSSTRHDLSVTIGRMSGSQFPSVCLASADDCCLSLSLSLSLGLGLRSRRSTTGSSTDDAGTRVSPFLPLSCPSSIHSLTDVWRPRESGAPVQDEQERRPLQRQGLVGVVQRRWGRSLDVDAGRPPASPLFTLSVHPSRPYIRFFCLSYSP
jgi:hypothetical protein